MKLIAIAAEISGETEVNPLQAAVDSLQMQLDASVNSSEVDRLQATIDTLMKQLQIKLLRLQTN